MKEEIDVTYKKTKLHDFLQDVMKLCKKHNVSIETTSINVLTGSQTLIAFHMWEHFTNLEADAKIASVYWPRIQTDIVLREEKK